MMPVEDRRHLPDDDPRCTDFHDVDILQCFRVADLEDSPVFVKLENGLAVAVTGSQARRLQARFRFDQRVIRVPAKLVLLPDDAARCPDCGGYTLSVLGKPGHFICEKCGRGAKEANQD